MVKIAAAVVVYLAGAFLTFGWVYNHEPEEGLPDPVRHQLVAFYEGMFWPIYWAGRGAIIVTGPAT